ncbi:CHASE2 domain-containing protein [Nostoc sp. FACHB-280]|uniref:CHASE2 domain-containing protein n=1 Tax=Nostoc sp. FACHB-280 TaxID=2692839 RepID=UPI00168A8670|nr:CHASE2 domain-containing protein [Nostoc sp. FACHB-280]MBD2495823.1 CHASE2 domain-containing protein [Nostoc sp. FACHB-280]
MAGSKFNLKIQQFDKFCSFELAWGQGQQIVTTLAYPDELNFKYQEWQRIYLRFYSTALRGKVEEVGSLLAPSIDWRSELVKKETELLSEFYRWLRSAELYEIRAEIAKATRNIENSYINIFISCNSLGLIRLPWEVWEIGTDFGLSSSKIRIIRTSINRTRPFTPLSRYRSGKARILVILGDETGLNFQAEKQALKSLKQLAEVEFIGWQPQENIPELKNKIVQAITSTLGWDILLFAGHSNETNLTGGEIAIAPNVALSVSELERPLLIAKEKGLRFALFNSCNGLSIADKLIDLGISQVAIMREPIHNQVAGKFILSFIQALSEYKDIHTSLITASQYFKLEKHFTYPSAYLIPSLFGHPEADLFYLKNYGIKSLFKLFKPTTQEIAFIGTLLVISLILPLQNLLLQQRILLQAQYRQLTNQLAMKVSQPPVLLVTIDEESIIKAKISNPKPMDRRYLASLVNKLTAYQAKVIGIDYLLDRPHPQTDQILANSIKSAVESDKHTLFVFITDDDKSVLPEIASLNWSLEGEVTTYPWYVKLLPYNYFQTQQPWNFASVLALAKQLQQTSNPPLPQLNNNTDYFQTVKNFLISHKQSNKTFIKYQRSHEKIITLLSYNIHQIFLKPIIDFSIPPEQVYDSIPAWKLLESQTAPQNLQQQVVMIVAGGYDEAGISFDGEDNYDQENLPLAIQYWHPDSKVFTGGEYNAYMVHHFLTGRLVVPIPEVWLIVLTVILSKIWYLWQNNRKSTNWYLLILPTSFTGLYGLVSLQLYISSFAILLPLLLPSATLWYYVLSTIYKRKANE